MALNLINIRPGFNKQITDTAAEGQYVDGDFVRFRYGFPEKVGTQHSRGQVLEPDNPLASLLAVSG